MAKIGVVIAAAGFLAATSAALAEQAARLPSEPVTLETARGPATFEAEIADDPRERSTGLMFREHLDEMQGMLFDFGGVTAVSMWMQNTYVPLDMIFIGANGTVLFIADNTVPGSPAVIGPVADTRAVLEVNAGTARRIGLAAGDKVRHRLFTPSP